MEQGRGSRAEASLADVAGLLRDVSSRSHPYAPLRAAALQAVDRLRGYPENGERLYAIVSRCDLRGELHKIVADDLGLSRSQFYRDLAKARRFIGEDIRTGLASDVRGRGRGVTLLDLRLQTALALSACGHGVAAVEHLAPIVPSLSGEEAIWGHSVLAELFLGSGEVKAAERELHLALGLCENERGPGMARALLTKATLLYENGSAADASVTLERSVTHLEPHAHAGSPLVIDALSTARSKLAYCYLERGDFKAAATTQARNPASNEGSPVLPATRIQYLRINAMLACDDSAGTARARQACNTFYQVAVDHGLLDEVSYALLQSAGIARFERRLEDAERFAQEALALQRAIDRRGTPVLSMLTCLAVDRGDYGNAVRLARKTRAEAAVGSNAWWHSYLNEAESLAQAGRGREARAICDRVARDAPPGGTRVAAWRRRIEAGIFGRLGDERAAYNAAGSALEILGEEAPPFYRLKSLLIAQQIHPTRSYRAQIRNLASVLRWDVPA